MTQSTKDSRRTPAASGTSYLLEIEWDGPDLPTRVGPFATRPEAEEWGQLNIPNGVWNVAPLAYPYLRAEPSADVYIVETQRGFTETFDEPTVQTLVNLGLIRHDRDGHVLQDGHGNGVGPVHHFYAAVTE